MVKLLLVSILLASVVGCPWREERREGWREDRHEDRRDDREDRRDRHEERGDRAP